jgi:hypothetical protein
VALCVSEESAPDDATLPTWEADYPFQAQRVPNLVGHAKKQEVLHMIISDELFIRAKAFVSSVANVCPSCPRRSVSACSTCVCENAGRLLAEMNGATCVPKTEKPKLTEIEIRVLKFIRNHERTGSQFTYCINRIRIIGVEAYEKTRAIKSLAAKGLIQLMTAKTLGGHNKHAMTVETARAYIDKEINANGRR